MMKTFVGFIVIEIIGGRDLLTQMDNKTVVQGKMLQELG